MATGYIQREGKSCILHVTSPSIERESMERGVQDTGEGGKERRRRLMRVRIEVSEKERVLDFGLIETRVSVRREFFWAVK